MLNRFVGLLKTSLLAAFVLLAHGCTDQMLHIKRLAPHAPFTSIQIPSPAPHTAVEQRLVGFPDGKLQVVWWQDAPDKTSHLQISTLANNQWTSPITVSNKGKIADAQFAAMGDGSVAGMWMISKPFPAGGEVQDIYTSKTDLADLRWTAPLKVNQEQETTGKSLPALAAFADGSLLTAWIDVPVILTISPDSPNNETDDKTASSLYVAKISPENTQAEVIPVDKKFCGCCAPALATNGQDALLVYRGLLPINIRDPEIIRITQDNYSTSMTIHNDHWVFDGCPASGPVVATVQSTVAVAWTTLINNRLIVRAAFSPDNGRHFATPIDVEFGNATGVIGIALEDPHSALLAWTRAGTEGEMIQLARVFDNGRIERRTTVHSLAKGGTYRWRGQHIVKANNSIFIGWHDEQGKKLGIAKVLVTE